MTFVLAIACASIPARADSLEAGFRAPPNSARPQTWWHWMNGNITKVGIKDDLEAMKGIGLGGATIVNVDCGIPRGPVPFMSPEWRQDFKYAVEEANRLGLKLCVENCAGWSSSGGPWNTPEHAMQRVTTSEVRVVGPKDLSEPLPQPPTKLDFYRDIAVLAFPTLDSGRDRIRNVRAKDGSNGGFVMSSPATTNAAPGAVIPLDAVVDLTSRLQPDGTLDWDVPAGHWTILRIGYTPTGVDNHPAPKEGEGLECDKLSKTALDLHWAGFMQKVLDDIGPLAGKALNCSLIDSYEVGGQNWTKNFRQEFQRLRGYDPLKYLPTFTGRVVQNPEVSERFLWDVRRTIADLFAENYYGHFAELCREHGLLNAVEPYTGPFESMQCGGPADVVMGEFWSGSHGNPSIRLAASIAHTYGKTFVGAESFTAAPGPHTGRWQEYPYALKTLGDLMYCQGLNRYIFHRYAMQPWTNRWPGMTMGQWGFHFERTETWWKDGKPWIDYITHCQYMLQQGRTVADAAYFTGQSVPVEMRAGNPALPAGYDYDAIDADVLMHQASVQDHQLVLKSGMRYHVLILPPSDRNMTPPLLRQLHTFVADGLTLVGAPPKASPSLEDYPECDAEVQRLASDMWGDCDGETVTEHAFGQGKVVWGQPMEQVFASLGVKPDFEFTTASGAKLAYTHRLDGNADIYFVSNQRRHFDQADCTFRVGGKLPELWNPQTGQIAPAPVWRAEGERTVVPLQFGPAGSIFVVFRSAASGDHLVSVSRQGPPLSEAPVQRAKLHILRAVYGAFPSGHGWIDVTTDVKSLLMAGHRRIRASNEMAGTDPAPNIRKQMRVQYRLGGRRHTMEVREGRTWTAPVGAQIISAYYGKLPARIINRRRTVDVTAKLAALVHGNELTVRAGNELAGDPAYLVPKELRVEYSLDGVHKTARVSEGDTLTLPETAQSIGTPPAYRISLDAQGQPRIFARAPGTFTLTEASGRSMRLHCEDVPKPVGISGAWQVHFPPGWKAPAEVSFPHLESWTANADSGVKYFSGTATYEKEIEIPEELLNPQRQLWLNLGKVKDFAEVALNGHRLGILWMPPFAVNITDVARPGRNELEVKVTNLWPNRLIGDEQLPPDCQWDGKQLEAWPQWFLEGKPSPTGRLTFTTWHHWTKNDPLLESGLLGPVRLVSARELTAP